MYVLLLLLFLMAFCYALCSVYFSLFYCFFFFFLKALKELLSSSIDLHMQVRICLFFFSLFSVFRAS